MTRSNQHRSAQPHSFMERLECRQPFYFFFLALCLICIAIYLFTVGYFLTRVELENLSNCSIVSRYDNNDGNIFRNTNSPLNGPLSDDVDERGCWKTGTPIYDQIIFVVIDALRFDFLVEHDGENQIPSLPKKLDLPYYNQLKSVHSTLKQYPNNSLIFKLAADAPTVTLQRLKAITTGTLPTFIDVSSNFDAAKTPTAQSTDDHMKEDSTIASLPSKLFKPITSVSSFPVDNILQQLHNAGKETVFMGDDTWLSLYPRAFDEFYPYPSFNVKDLHTVDHGVIRHLMPTLRSKSPAFLVAHFLGVDHVGHRYDARHPAMKDKLQELNKVLNEVIQYVENPIERGDKRVLFAVLGDHGMTEDGNHGGSTDEEVNAGLFLFSSHPLVDDETLIWKESFDSEKRDSFVNTGWAGLNGHDRIPRINQIDLVPTISLLLGLPIPFSNIGTVIPQLFLQVDSIVNSTQFPPSQAPALASALRAYYLNAIQVHTYLHAYVERSSGFSFEELQHVDKLFNNSIHKYALLRGSLDTEDRDPSSINEEMLASLKLFILFLSDASQMCRTKWTQFSIQHMIAGLLLFTGILMMLGYRFYRIQHFDLDDSGFALTPRVMEFPIWCALACLQIVFLLSTDFTFLQSTLFTVAICGIICLAQVQLTVPYANSKTSVSSPNSYYSDLFAAVCLLVHYQGLFTNSFIISEKGVVLFLLNSLIMYQAMQHSLPKTRNSIDPSNPKITSNNQFVVSLSHFRIFRFNFPYYILPFVSTFGFRAILWINDSSPFHTLTTESFPVTICAIIITAFIILLGAILYAIREPILLLATAYPNGFLRIFFKLVFYFYIPLASVCSLSFWIFQSPSSYFFRILCPRVVYIFSLIIFLIGIFLYRNFLNILEHPTSNIKNKELVHRSALFLHYSTISTSLLFPVLLLLGPISILVVLFSFGSYLVFNFSVRQLGSGSENGIANLNSLAGASASISTLYLSAFHYFLTSYLFFATNHSSSFSSLAPSAAFIGFDEFSYYFAGLFLFLNTFANVMIALPFLPALLSSSYSPLPLQNHKSIYHSLFYQFYFHLIRLSCTALNAYIQRRHLMVWDVFAPKFVFDTLSALCAQFVIVLLLFSTPRSPKVQKS